MALVSTCNGKASAIGVSTRQTNSVSFLKKGFGFRGGILGISHFYGLYFYGFSFLEAGNQ